MKYPYIGFSETAKSTVLFYDERSGTCLKEGLWAGEKGKYYKCICDDSFKNITREYLANTKVKIESEDHSFFIQELAFKSGYIWIDGSSRNIELSGGCIVFNEESMTINHIASPVHSAYKLITIPLPPKGPEPKEWPQVGEEVSLRYRFDSKEIHITGKLEFISDKHLIVDDCHKLRSEYDIEKPLTPEEELTSAFVEYEKSNSYGYSWKHLAKAIINGEIKGLSYKPE